MPLWYKVLRISKNKFELEGFNIVFDINSVLAVNQCEEILLRVFGDQNLYELKIFSEQNRGDFSFLANSKKYVLAHFHPGVTDNKGEAAQEALNLFGIKSLVSSFKIYECAGEFTPAEYGNPLVENIIKMSQVDLSSWFFENKLKYIAEKTITPEVCVFNLNLSNNDLDKLQQEKCLALGQSELAAIKEYFLNPSVSSERNLAGLPTLPTDVEIEIIAQTWSEHCKHKIFNAEIDYSEDHLSLHKKFGAIKIKGLFKTYIKKSTEDIISNRKIPWAISLFSDNAGVVQYEKDILACLKVETHNSPSALDPYGGSLTGILGVNRDILGVGLGAKPVANFDMFCLTPPDFPKSEEVSDLLVGVSHPQKIIKGVHKGVEDGGNKSGIPTINGSYFFDLDYLAKPLVFVGTLGLMPDALSENRKPAEKNILPGDYIVMAGGKIGRDGIHGATFSSLELDTSGVTELSTVVQIGDPLCQRRLTDFILRARDLNLFRAITDNGAGGLSSSIGEMAQMSDGAILRLEKCPLKTHGLLPYEVVISESQERMTLAVDPKKFSELSKLAEFCGVDIFNIGEFNSSKKFEVTYHQELMASLPLTFLHNPPDLKLKAYFKTKNFRSIYRRGLKKEAIKFQNGFLETALKKLLSDPNIASKEDWIRRFDHEVGAKTVIKPYGSKFNSPNGAGGIKSRHGVYLLGHGLAPKWTIIDPYISAIRAVDEALRNIVAAGADPQKISILDNFCTPDPVASEKNQEGEWQLARLVRANIGLREVAISYGTPLISGKDSMKNDFVGKNLSGKKVKHSILPTLLVTALGFTQEEIMNKGSFINEGDIILMIGPGINTHSLTLSSLEENMQTPRSKESFNQIYNFDLAQNFTTFKAIYELHQHNCFTSISDVNEDGALVNLFELLMGSGRGAKLELDQGPNDLAKLLFGSSLATFVSTVSKNKYEILKSICEKENIPYLTLGSAQKDYKLNINSREITEKINMSDIENIYRTSFTPGEN